MATLYVRSVPDELHKWLEQRAAYLGMSTAALVRLILVTAMHERWPDHRFNHTQGSGNAAVHTTTASATMGQPAGPGTV